MEWSVVGHSKQKAYLERLIERAVLPHTLLLAGPQGVGKRMMAEDIAAILVPGGSVLDRMTLAPEVDEEDKRHAISIEAVHNLKSWIALRPTGAHKVVIVDTADWMTGDAANTMLKMLEEPPAYAYFLLITSRPGAILPTIASRCERIDFSALTDDETAQVLSGLKLTTDNAQLLHAIAAGRPGVIMQLVNDKRLPEVADAVAGLEKALKAGVAERLAYAKEVVDAEHAEDVVSWWLSWVRSRMPERPQLAPVATSLLTLHDAMADPAFNRRLALDRFFLSW